MDAKFRLAAADNDPEHLILIVLALVVVQIALHAVKTIPEAGPLHALRTDQAEFDQGHIVGGREFVFNIVPVFQDQKMRSVVASAITKVPLEKVVKASLPYLWMLLVSLLILTLFPPIITILPKQLASLGRTAG